MIEERTGKSIADLFLEDGEDGFRALERQVVAEALASHDGVLALGGGAVLAAETRALLRGHRVVHLSVGLADGLRRTGMSTARPLLAGVNPRATFKALLDARAPLYREVATVQVATDRRSANQVARAVLEALGEVPASAPQELVDPARPARPAHAARRRPAAGPHRPPLTAAAAAAVSAPKRAQGDRRECDGADRRGHRAALPRARGPRGPRPS